MKKILTRGLISVLLIATIISLAACGKKNDGGETGENTNSPKISTKQGKDNLIEIGKAITGDIENNYGSKHNATIKIDQVIRGDEALNYINDQKKGFYS